jgi:hypothetical protein
MPQTPTYEPRATRLAINLPVQLLRSDGTRSSATITNVSQRGFRLRTPDTPRVGERVVLRGEVADVPAEVRWASGDQVGGVFLQPEHR